MKDDTISRQAAIDALRKLREEDIEDYGCEIPEGFNQDHLDRATFAIKQLPSAQLSTNLAEVGTDCISRQAAIEVIDAVFPVDPMKSEYAQGIACGAALAKTYVEQLPPAQPDIIRCRNCKFASGDSRICMKFGHSPIGELDFCAWAERRTDE